MGTFGIYPSVDVEAPYIAIGVAGCHPYATWEKAEHHMWQLGMGPDGCQLPVVDDGADEPDSVEAA